MEYRPKILGDSPPKNLQLPENLTLLLTSCLSESLPAKSPDFWKSFIFSPETPLLRVHTALPPIRTLFIQGVVGPQEN